MSEAAPDPTTQSRRRAPTIASDAAASVAARIVAMVASSATALLVLTSVDKQDYGSYALAVGLAGMLAVVLDLGTSSSLARYVAHGQADTALFARVACARMGVFLVGAAVLALVGGLERGSSAFVDLLPVAALVLLAQGLVAFLYGTLPATRRIRLLVVVTVLQPLFELAGVAVARVAGWDVAAMLLASAVAGVAASVVGYGAIAVGRASLVRADFGGGGGDVGATARRDEERRRLATVPEVFAYGRRLVAVLVVMTVFGQIDQFVIAWFHDAADVAPYALVIKVQALLAAPVIAATSIVAPRIASAGAAAASTYRRWLVLYAVLYLGACGVFAVLARDLFLALDPDYARDFWLLVAMLPFIFLSVLAMLPSVTLNQIGHAGSRVRIAVTSLAIDAVLDLALVPGLVAYGAAIATTLAFAYYAWAHHRMLEPLLERSSGAPAPAAAPLLLRGAGLALVMAGIAWMLAHVVGALDASQRVEAVVTVVVAAGIPAVLHLVATARLVRRGMPDPGSGPATAGA